MLVTTTACLLKLVNDVFECKYSCSTIGIPAIWIREKSSTEKFCLTYSDILESNHYIILCCENSSAIIGSFDGDGWPSAFIAIACLRQSFSIYINNILSSSALRLSANLCRVSLHGVISPFLFATHRFYHSVYFFQPGSSTTYIINVSSLESLVCSRQPDIVLLLVYNLL